MRRPPVLVVFVAILVIAIGETAGAVMSQLRPATQRLARSRVDANREAHGLTGSREYDDEVTARAVYTAEAGLSFMHTHAEGLGPLVLLATTLVAGLVTSRRLRGALYVLFSFGVMFPLGYLLYGLAALERGRDEGVALVEQYVLPPLGGAVITGLVVLLVAVARAARGGGAGSTSGPA